MSDTRERVRVLSCRPSRDFDQIRQTAQVDALRARIEMSAREVQMNAWERFNERYQIELLGLDGIEAQPTTRSCRLMKGKYNATAAMVVTSKWGVGNP